MNIFLLGLMFWFLIFPNKTLCQHRTWEFGGAGGVVKNFKTPLKIYQKDEAAIKIGAKYKTEPLKPPVYYDLRIVAWQDTKGWALKFSHHKIILQNKPADIQRFSITDGFNLITLNRLWQNKGFIYSIGGGAVITHPESTIRNQPFPEDGGILKKGYYLSGPTGEVARTKKIYLTNCFLLNTETRFTASYVRVPVQNGHAQVTNAALHFLGGFGYQFGRQK